MPYPTCQTDHIGRHLAPRPHLDVTLRSMQQEHVGGPDLQHKMHEGERSLNHQIINLTKSSLSKKHTCPY